MSDYESTLSEKAETFLNWAADHITFADVIDLYFIVSDLVDIQISETERCETAYFDAMAMNTIDSAGKYGNIPIGKLVL